MNRNTLLSLGIGLLGGFLASRFLGAKNGQAMGGTRFYPYKTDWDTENRAKAIMQSLANVRSARMGDFPSSFYGGYEAIPGWTGDPTFLDIYDPDGPRNPLWAWGFPVGGRSGTN